MQNNLGQANVAIIGAGISGPVLALTILSDPKLRSLYKPVIYDKLPSPKELSDESATRRGRYSYAAGAAVALTSNALHPLYQLGLKDSLNKVSSETTTINIWRAFSNDAKSVSSDSPCPHKWYNIIRNPGWNADLDTCLRVVERRDLQGILLDKIQQLGGEVMWNKKLKEVQSLERRKLKLVFDDGSSVDTDLLVGGDGNWSSVRKYIIEQKGLKNPETRWAPEFPYCDGVYGISTKLGDADSEWNGPGDTHWLLLDEGVTSTWSLPDGKWFWTISLPQARPPERRVERLRPGDLDDEEPENSQSTYRADITSGGYSIESTLEILRKHETVWHPVSGSFKEIFQHSDRIVRAPVWHRAWEVDEIGNSNAVVIGDASRAMLPSSGQGACFAIEDATILANSLLEHARSGDEGLDFETAISEYARLRVPRSKRMASQAYWAGVVGLAARWWWRWLRDFGSSWLPLGGDPKASPEKKDPMGWLYSVGFKVGSEEAEETRTTQ